MAAVQGASPEAIQSHYDVGNDFYALWLDRTLTYSSALWEGPDDALEAAQMRKVDFHIDQARAAGAGRVLDIGCGWGTMLRRLVERGAGRAVGLTLSEAQAEAIAARGDPRIEARLESWADHAPAEPYDAIVSIGAFEHFARAGLEPEDRVACYRRFFDAAHALLRPGGRLSLQTIARGTPPRITREFLMDVRFMLNEIFPQSDLGRLAEIIEAMEGRFEVVALRNDRQHYARTCRVWLERLRARRAEAERVAGRETLEKYARYLDISARHFETGAAVLLRLTLARLGE